MPYMTNGKRNYKAELAWEKRARPNRVKDRAARNSARATVAKKKGVDPTSLSGDVGHRKALSKGGGSYLSNLFVQDSSKNRSFSRNKDGSMKSETSKRERRKSK